MTGTPTWFLDHRATGNTGQWLFRNGTGAGTTQMSISGSGIVTMSAYGLGTATFSAAGVISSVSDERMKRNIRPFTRGLEAILALRPILHGYTAESGIDNSGKDDYAGFSAQNVQSVIPEAVGQNRDGMLSLSDRGILASLVNAVKELSALVKAPADPAVVR